MEHSGKGSEPVDAVMIRETFVLQRNIGIGQILRNHAFVGVRAVSHPNAVLLAVKAGKLHGFVIGIIRIDNRGLVLILWRKWRVRRGGIFVLFMKRKLIQKA